MSTSRVFDLEHYELLNRARGAVLSSLLSELKSAMNLRNVIDVGCGLGYFSGFLKTQGLEVIAVDGRRDNVEEAAKRFPGVKFRVVNAEDHELRSTGVFDLTICFGLLYHLENPFLVIRHLRAITKSLLLVEGLIYPGDDPVMGLVEETPFEDQGLQHIAFYPTEACLIKMLYQSGFPYVYGLATAPDHSEYHGTSTRPKNRTMLAASYTALPSTLLRLAHEPPSATKPWITRENEARKGISVFRRFARGLFLKKRGQLGS